MSNEKQVATEKNAISGGQKQKNLKSFLHHLKLQPAFFVNLSLDLDHAGLEIQNYLCID